MFGTVFSLAAGLFLIFYPLPGSAQMPWNGIMASMIVFGSLLILALIFTQMLAWVPLQKTERDLTPRILEIYRRDLHMRFGRLWLILVPLASIFIAFAGTATGERNRLLLAALWILLFGISLDVLNHMLKRVLSYLNPFAAVEMFTHLAKTSVQNDKEIELCDSIDALSEAGVKSLQTGGHSLGTKVIDELLKITRNFLEASRSIAHPANNAETKKLGIDDKVSFTLFYIFQRIEQLNKKAVEQHLETVCSIIAASLGKIIVYAAKCDISLAGYPVHYLGRSALEAQKKGMPEVAVKATLTLVEAAKTLIDELDATYLELQEPFLMIVSNLHEIAKETFVEDKSTHIPLLIQPFREIRALFTTDKMANHPDTPAIVASIDSVIAEFDALDMVMKTMPPIPAMPESQAPAQQESFPQSSPPKEQDIIPQNPPQEPRELEKPE